MPQRGIERIGCRALGHRPQRHAQRHGVVMPALHHHEIRSLPRVVDPCIVLRDAMEGTLARHRRAHPVAQRLGRCFTTRLQPQRQQHRTTGQRQVHQLLACGLGHDAGLAHAEPQAVVRLGHQQRHPTHVGHVGPQRLLRGIGPGQGTPCARERVVVGEETVGRRVQHLLLVVQCEIHGGRRVVVFNQFLGRPSICSARMLRCTSEVPARMVSARVHR